MLKPCTGSSQVGEVKFEEAALVKLLLQELPLQKLSLQKLPFGKLPCRSSFAEPPLQGLLL